ncbi:MAG: hypothetical protein ACFFEN_13110 [Candidatus Thorarchaeota archaeon]
MQSELDKTDKGMFLRILQNSSYYKQLLGFNNFEKQKSKVSVFHISKRIQSLIDRTRRDKISRIIPIIGIDEDEETQFYDLLNSNLKDFRIVFIPSPPSGIDFYYHIYMCIIEEFGLEILEEASNNLIKRCLDDRKPQIDEILKKGIENFTGKRFKCFKALLSYTLDSKKRDLARKWLILDELTEGEIEDLGIKSFNENVRAFELIKIISESLENPILLYFEDIEMPNVGILESLKRLHHDIKNLTILMMINRITWDHISNNNDQSFLSILEPEQTFYEFESVKRFVQIAMEIYWTQNDIKPPENPFFPLSEELLKKFFRKLRGDVKSFLNLCINSIEEIGSGEVTLEQLLENKKKETNLVM